MPAVMWVGPGLGSGGRALLVGRRALCAARRSTQGYAAWAV